MNPIELLKLLFEHLPAGSWLIAVCVLLILVRFSIRIEMHNKK
jgi:hypothetical protein